MAHDGGILTGRETSAVVLLVVDDGNDYREILCETLEEEGYRAESANHGAALARLREGTKPALILLDLMMPVMDGWGFMSELRKDPALASIPVIVTTGGGDRLLASAPVASGYLNKPITRKLLLEVIALCLFRAHSKE